MPLLFDVTNATFADETHYSIHGTSHLGYLHLYLTPEGMGGQIDLISRLFTMYPLGESLGVLFENDLNSGEIVTCGNTDPVEVEEAGFCDGDCGPAVLDILILRTPEANQFLSPFGVLGEYFLFKEGYNLNFALANSDIPNKIVRIYMSNFTPDFSYDDIDEAVSDLSGSTAAKALGQTFGADIIVMLVNISTDNTFGKVNTVDPLANNKVAVVQIKAYGSNQYLLVMK